MITVSRKEAKEWIKNGELPQDMVKDGITVVMSRKHAEKWLTKLEDGTQKQAKETLYNSSSGGFCCLGLEQACNWGGKVEAEAGESGALLPLGYPSMEYLRSTGKMYFNSVGQCATAPYLDKGKAGYRSAAALNDEGVTFKTIAKRLRKRLAVYD